MLRRLLQQQEEPHRGALKQKTSAEVGSCLQQMAAFKKSVVGLPAYQAFAVMRRSKMKWEKVRGTAAGTPERVREETENIRK
ncbi:unnamed protein product [Sphagnum tenellum]